MKNNSIKKPIYKKWWFYLIVAIIIIGSIGALNNDDSNKKKEEAHVGEAKTPSSSDSQKGKNYLEVIEIFEKQGFVNIKTETIDDLIIGWLTKDGEVESVAVDGDTDYKSDKWYPKETEVLILYHTFPEKDDEKANQNQDQNEPDNQEDDFNKIVAIYNSAIGKMASDVRNELNEYDYQVEFKHENTKMDFTEMIFDKDDEANAEFYLPWIITGTQKLDDKNNVVIFLINTEENMDRLNEQASTTEKLSSKLSASTAWAAVSLYGEREFPYGFKLNSILGVLAETAVDEDTWFIKSKCQVKNEQGKWAKDFTCEAYITGTDDNPKVKNFKIY